jgi:hypothetical protein
MVEGGEGGKWEWDRHGIRSKGIRVGPLKQGSIDKFRYFYFQAALTSKDQWKIKIYFFNKW